MTAEIELRHAIPNIADISSYVRGGKGKFTLLSTKTNVHRTYSMYTPEDQNPLLDRRLYVKFLNGLNEFEFIGTIWEASSSKQLTFTLGRSVRPTLEADCVKGILWLVDKLNWNKELKGIIFFHEGICCRCGRSLTNPESIERGIGPYCASQ